MTKKIIARQSLQIKAWMVLSEIKQADVATALGVSRTHVNAVISGNRNSRRVLKYLLKKGCSAEWLAIPEQRWPNYEDAE